MHQSLVHKCIAWIKSDQMQARRRSTPSVASSLYICFPWFGVDSEAKRYGGGMGWNEAQRVGGNGLDNARAAVELREGFATARGRCACCGTAAGPIPIAPRKCRHSRPIDSTHPPCCLRPNARRRSASAEWAARWRRCGPT
eukprot:356031-Chlamydomonas_euryale.AAC.1